MRDTWETVVRSAKLPVAIGEYLLVGSVLAVYIRQQSMKAKV